MIHHYSEHSIQSDDVNLVGIMDGSAIAYSYGWHSVDSLTNVENIEILNGSPTALVIETN